MPRMPPPSTARIVMVDIVERLPSSFRRPISVPSSHDSRICWRAPELNLCLATLYEAGAHDQLSGGRIVNLVPQHHGGGDTGNVACVDKAERRTRREGREADVVRKDDQSRELGFVQIAFDKARDSL